MKIIKLTICTLILSLFLAGCASNKAAGGKGKKVKKDKDTTVETFLDNGDFAGGIGFMENQIAKRKNDKNLIKDNFDLAMLYHFSGSYSKSKDILTPTDIMMDDYVTKSVSQGIFAAIGNENAVEYEANPYEYIYINIFNSLNYYNLGSVEDAGVEIRRMNDKQRVYFSKYGEVALSEADYDSKDDNSAAYSALQIDPSKVAEMRPSKPTSADVFKDSAAARYLSLLFYMMDGDKGNAKLDARIIAALNPSFDTESEMNISSGKGRLDVLSFTDLIGRRQEKRVVIGPFDGLIFNIQDVIVTVPAFDIEFVYPEFSYIRDSRVTGVRITAGDQVNTLNLLEDFNYAVNQDVNIKARRAYNRSVARSLTKKLSAVTSAVTAVVTAQVAAKKADNPVAIAITKASAIAAWVALPKAIEAVDKTETADIRQVDSLPAKVYAGGLELEPGVYEVKVEYLSGDSVIKTQNFEGVQVNSGKPSILETQFIKN